MQFSCTVDKILTAIICPLNGNLKSHRNQIFEISITSYNEPVILTIMLNISYKLVSQIENYKRSLRNYTINKDRLEGFFKIDECGNYKPVSIFNFHLLNIIFSFYFIYKIIHLYILTFII